MLDLDRKELAAVREAVAARDWRAASQAWARHLKTRRQPRWVWPRFDRAALLRLHVEKSGGLARHTNAAHHVLARDFELLGVRKQLAHRVEWFHGPIEWTRVLSRFRYWRDVGYACWGTGNPAYAKDFVFLLKSWIVDNPVPSKPSNRRGTNGSVWRTLEAGIRSDMWFEAMELFLDAPAFDAEAKLLMTKSLVEHARYLRAWSTAYRAGNWQVCEASGLAAIGIMLPASLCTVLTPFADTATLPTVKPLGSADPLVVRLVVSYSSGQQDGIAIATKPTVLTVGPHEAKALALCVRRGSSSNAVIVVSSEARP